MTNSRRRSLPAVLALALLAPLAGIGVDVGRAEPAAAYPSTHIDVVGKGFGHGRGMGQYGSLGYALQGWNHHDILQHYYGNTYAGSTPDDTIRVRLDPALPDMIVTSAQPFTVGLVHFQGGQAARIRQGGDPLFIDVAPSCAGPWSPVGSTSGITDVAPSDPNQGDDRDRMLLVCTPSGSRFYRGVVRAQMEGSTFRAINLVPMESYLRGVVPRESPAFWGSLGGGRGMEALRAQAVAARSYAWADKASNSGRGRFPGVADTCNTESCQVFGGVEMQGTTLREEANTDVAVATTAGQVRRMSNHAFARTEFSSSTGGHSAGGTFPAVPDGGDRPCPGEGCNPYHRWSTRIAVADIETRFNLGTLLGIRINSRNGLGDFGGRIRSMTLVFTGGQVLRDNDSEIRSALGGTGAGIRSDWFAVVDAPEPPGIASFPYHVVARDGAVFSFGGASYHGSTKELGIPTPIRDMAEGADGGYWLMGEDAEVYGFGAPWYGSMRGQPLTSPVVGLAATATGRGYWEVAGDGGIFTFGDAGFYGSTGALRLNRPVVGMSPHPSGNGYWLVAGDGGIFSFGDVAFHGSTGDLRLNQPVFAMAATPSGNGYWLVASDGGIFTFGDAGYHGSLPERGIGETAVALVASPSGEGYLIVTREGRVHGFGDASPGGGPRTYGHPEPTVGAARPL